MTSTLVTSCTALPPEGANFSRGGPSKNYHFSTLAELENACEFMARHIGVDEADEALMLKVVGIELTARVD